MLMKTKKKRKRFRATNSENLPDEKFQVPDLSGVEQFFEQNQFPRKRSAEVLRPLPVLWLEDRGSD